ncbi:hypothetical protein FOCC_FOCC014593 [Frankliniella occidentalis]|nr:hypothetical protein FOCC_FOCC014593 [Frankliniella occidentalis]
MEMDQNDQNQIRNRGDRILRRRAHLIRQRLVQRVHYARHRLLAEVRDEDESDETDTDNSEVDAREGNETDSTDSENNDDNVNLNGNDNQNDNDNQIDDNETESDNHSEHDNENNSGSNSENNSVNDNDSDNQSDSDQDNINDDSDDSDDEDFNVMNYLKNGLQNWAMRGVSKRKVDELLKMLRRVHPELPKSYKTLLHTPKTTNVVQIENGNIWYKGVRNCLNQVVTQDYLNNSRAVYLDINIDGLPLFRSSKAQFWPILGCLSGVRHDPFIIAIYFGCSKPATLHQFLNELIEELRDLFVNGFWFDGVQYNVHVKNFICDAAARSYVKCIIPHSGYFGCEKCEVRGRWYLNRMTFASLIDQLRTDQSFRDRRNQYHHLGISPLEDEQLQLGMVSMFRLDPQHLVYLGVVRKLLQLKLDIRNRGRLRDDEVEEFKVSCGQLGQYFPREFNRKPRKFDAVKDLKASELRRLALYDGLKLMKDALQHDEYQNFLLLHCCLFILESPLLIEHEEMLTAAEEFAKLFVRFSIDLYGLQFCIYNVHSLIHLVDEVRSTQLPLYSFSSFPFENHLKTIKQTLRSGYHPLQQIARRDAETGGKLTEPKEVQNGVTLHDSHFDPGEAVAGQQFKLLKSKCFSLSLNQADRCFKIRNGSVLILQNIVQTDNGIILRGKRFLQMDNYFDYPMESSVLGTFLVSNLSENIESCHFDNLDHKCVLMPDGLNLSYLCVPLIHTVL